MSHGVPGCPMGQLARFHSSLKPQSSAEFEANNLPLIVQTAHTQQRNVRPSCRVLIPSFGFCFLMLAFSIGLVEKVVQFGDSFSAGAVVEDPFSYYKPSGCWRSTKNWGQLYTESVDPGGEYINRACGGARIEHINGEREMNKKWGWYLFRPCPSGESLLACLPTYLTVWCLPACYHFDLHIMHGRCIAHLTYN